MNFVNGGNKPLITRRILFPASPCFKHGMNGVLYLGNPLDLPAPNNLWFLKESSPLALPKHACLHFNGWIYAFTFPAIKTVQKPFPIKVGLTTAADVDTRVFGQCKGSGFFEKPEILGRWQVKRVGQVEDAIHAVLKARGRWKEDAPGDEWFITTIDEVQSIVSFINS